MYLWVSNNKGSIIVEGKDRDECFKNLPSVDSVVPFMRDTCRFKEYKNDLTLEQKNDIERQRYTLIPPPSENTTKIPKMNFDKKEKYIGEHWPIDGVDFDR